MTLARMRIVESIERILAQAGVEEPSRTAAARAIMKLYAADAEQLPVLHWVIEQVTMMRNKLHAANRPALRDGLRVELRSDCDHMLAEISRRLP